MFEVAHTPDRILWRIALGYDEDELSHVDLEFERQNYEREAKRSQD